MLKVNVVCVTCGVSKPRADYQLPTGKKLAKRCASCRASKAVRLREPCLLTGVRDIFHTILLHLPLKDVLNCAVTKQTRSWLDDNVFWEGMTKHKILYDPRSISSPTDWKQVFRRFWKKGFFYNFKNQHDLTPRVDFSGQQWEPELMVDGVPTMKLPWFFSTTEFWLQPLNQTTFTLKSERIRDALNSTDIDFLCQEELHKHIGQIFPQGEYVIGFRTIVPHWFDGDDKQNYFNNQHYRFGNRHEQECPLKEGFYQTFWEKPFYKEKSKTINSDKIPDELTFYAAIGLFELIIPLQDRTKLDNATIESYKQKIQNGLVPTVLSLGMIDDRTPIGWIPEGGLTYAPKYEHLTTIVNWIIDGHHKIEAARQMNRPVRFLQFINRDCYNVMENPKDEDFSSSYYSKLATHTSPKRSLCQSTVGYPIKKAGPFPPILIYRLWNPWGNHKEIEAAHTEEAISFFLLRNLTCAKESYGPRRVEKGSQEPLSDFLLHFVLQPNKCYVWPKTVESYYFLTGFGLVITEESVREGLYEAPPPLPQNPKHYYVPAMSKDTRPTRPGQ